MNQTLLKKQTKADSFLDFRWLCHWYQGFPCLFIECCFHAYFWCAFSLRRLRLTQGRQDTPSPKYENNIPWTATDIPDINTLHSLSHNLCLRYLDFQKLYNICTIGAHVGRFDLSPPLRPEKGVGGTRALAHSIRQKYHSPVIFRNSFGPMFPLRSQIFTWVLRSPRSMKMQLKAYLGARLRKSYMKLQLLPIPINKQHTGCMHWNYINIIYIYI